MAAAVREQDGPAGVDRPLTQFGGRFRFRFRARDVAMTHISAAEYMAEMRRLEAIRNEALRHHDRSALASVALRQAAVNRVFWGKEPKSG